MSELQDTLNALAASGGYELSAYEAEAAYELENYFVANGKTRGEARPLATKAAANPAVREALLNMTRGSNQGVDGFRGQGGDGAPMAAQFDLVATRVTAAIVAPLPFAFFGTQDAQNQYSNTYVLPAGVTVTGVRFGANGIGAAPFATVGDRLTAQFTDAALNTDSVEVSALQMPYPALLQSMQVDLLRISKIRYIISDATQQTQYARPISLRYFNMFGRNGSNQLSLSAALDPKQFQSGVRDMNGAYNIDKETSLNNSIIPVVGFSVQMSMWVEKLYAQTTKGWK